MNKTTKTRRHEVGIKIFLSFVSLCLCGSLLACGGKTKPDTARKLLAQELHVPEERVEVTSVSELGGIVLAEGSLKITFVLQKDAKGKWSVVRMKYSDGWQTPEEFLKSVPEKSSLTRSLESALLTELKKEGTTDEHR